MTFRRSESQHRLFQCLVLRLFLYRCSLACTNPSKFFLFSRTSHIMHWLKRSSFLSSSCVWQIWQKSLGPLQALQKSKTSSAGTMPSKWLKIKSTGMFELSFLKMLRQSIENISQLASFAALFLMRQRIGLRMKLGRETLWFAIRSTTNDRLWKGESKINPLTSQANIYENMIEQSAPMLLPQRVTRPIGTLFLTSCRKSRISNTSLMPQVRVSESLLPHPKKSKLTTFILNLGIKLTKGSASILVPPFPCRYSTVCSVSTAKGQQMNPEICL